MLSCNQAGQNCFLKMSGDTFYGAKSNNVKISSWLQTLKEKMVINLFTHCHSQNYGRGTKRKLPVHAFLRSEIFNTKIRRDKLSKSEPLVLRKKKVMIAKPDIMKKILNLKSRG